MKKYLRGGGIFLLLILILSLSPIVFVGAGERGVLLHFGAVDENIILEPGLNWKVPFRDSVVKMDVKTQKEERGASASSKDMQIVSSKVAINYHLDPDKVDKLYKKLKKDYSDRVISPAIEEFTKKITAHFTAEELISKREEVKEELRSALTENLAKNHIIVEDIFITDFDFSEEFNRAIEAKVTAEQKALEAKNKLEQIKYEAEQKLTTAKAEAEAIKIQAQAITQQGGRDYVRLQAINKWNGQLPTQMVPNATVPFIDLTK